MTYANGTPKIKVFSWTSLVFVAIFLPHEEITVLITVTHTQSFQLRVVWQPMDQTTLQRRALVKHGVHSLNSWWLCFYLILSCSLFSLLLTLALKCSLDFLTSPFEIFLSPWFSHLASQLFWSLTLSVVSGQRRALLVEPSVHPQSISVKWLSEEELDNFTCLWKFFPVCSFLFLPIFPLSFS